MQYFLFLLLNLFFMFLLIWNNKKLSKIYNIFDVPNSRKLHKTPVSLSGGMYIYIFFIFYFISFVLIFNLEIFLNTYLFFSLKDLIVFFVILTFLFIIGILDDKFGITSFKRIFLYFFLIYIYVHQNTLSEISNIYFNNIKYLEISKLSKFLSIFLIMAALISMNLYDGINGQTAFFYLLNFLILTIFLNSYLFSLIILIPVSFFTYLNLKNKVFLGEGGVNILCFFYIVIIIKFYNLKIVNNLDLNYIFFVILIPIIDAIRLFIKRVFQSGNPLKADKDHIHHRLIKVFGNGRSLCLLTFPLSFVFLIFFYKLNSFFVLILGIFYYLLLFFITKQLKFNSSKENSKNKYNKSKNKKNC